MLTTINTDRLTLEKLTTDDCQFMVELLNSRGWLDFIGNRNVRSKEEAIAYIERIINTPDLTYWVVRVSDSDTPIGIISFMKRVYLAHFDIGFAFLPAHQGKGYAYEAASDVLTRVSGNPLHTTILATTLPKNSASIQLLTKLGFHFYKTMKVGAEDLYVYATGRE